MKRHLVALLALIVALNANLTHGETPAAHDARMTWWREARFGMFIHWGLYAQAGGFWNGESVPGGSEWIMNDARIPVADYAKMAEKFNPVKFNADEWVAIAKQAGMKYIIITAKHHDGFAMFHTAVDGYNIYDATPFKRDPLAELAVACKKQGIKFGFYYSQAQDWHHAGGARRGEIWDSAQQGNMDDYLKNVAVPQVKELLTEYGPVAVLWWDTPMQMSPDRAALLSPLLSFQPQLITNDRLGGGYRGDTGTPEGEIPPFKETEWDWETCMTMNGSWGYRSDGLQSVRKSESLLLDLINTASKGGNYLLNVGPSDQGEIPSVEAAPLREIGKWLQINGESIYGTSAAPFRKKPSWGRVTQRPGKLYLHVQSQPSDGKIIVPVSNRATKVYLLADPKHLLNASTSAQGMTVSLPPTLPDPINTVVVAEIADQVSPLAEDNTARPAADGSIRCDSFNAWITAGQDSTVNQSIFAGNENHPFIEWNGKRGAEDTLQWQLQSKKEGDYDVILNYATWPYQAGNAFALTVGEQTLNATFKATESGYRGEDVKIGTVHLSANGVVPMTLKGTDVKQGGVCSRLFSVILTPSGGN